MLWDLFLNNTGRPIHKWKHYFPAYERHFARYRNIPLRLLEIGCGKGGSLGLWKQYLGPHAQIVGVDIDPIASTFSDDQINIAIGDQADTKFLENLNGQYGPFDIIIDDGGHTMQQMSTSFDYLYPKMCHSGVYMIEDLHCCYWPEYGGGIGTESSFIERIKRMIDELHQSYFLPQDSHKSWFSSNTRSICMYDSLVVFERGSLINKSAPIIPLID